MVPVVKPPGKQKPPTPPKPVHFPPVSAYKRLIDSKYTSPLLEIVDHRTYNSSLPGLNDSANDDTAPLIDDETNGHPNAATTPKPLKPPLLPKPQHIPSTKCTSLPNELESKSPKKSQPSQPNSSETKANSSNPFKNDANENPLNPFAAENAKSLNPFTTETIPAERHEKSGLNLIEYLTSTTINETRYQHKVKASTLSRFDNLTNFAHENEFTRRVERSSEISTKISSESHISRSLQSIGYFHSLDEIHKQFESDKESLLDKDFVNVRNNILRKRIIDIKTESVSPENDRSNRNSWRSSSEVEFGENRSRSSSIAENEYWLRNSQNNCSASKRNESNVDDDEKEPNYDDDDSVGNSSSESYSVRRRLKTWLGSFGKGGKTVKRRDSVFYVESESDSKNNAMWETASTSSNEENANNDQSTVNNDTDTNGFNLNGTTDFESEQESETNPEAKKERKAFMVIQELISSEKVFIDVLSLLTDDFVNFVKNVDKDPIIPEQELDKIIDYLPQLKSFNEDLLKDFEGRMDNWTLYPKISDIIIRKGPFLKLFSTYIKNFEKQCNLLDEGTHKYNRFAKAIKDFEATDRCKKLSLKHYMLKPVQRLPQYRLLLEEYLSHQNPNSIDYDDTQRALRIVCDVADHANKTMQQDLNIRKMLELQSRLNKHEIIKPGRIFVKEGELWKLSRKDLQYRYFILFNDCLLCTTSGPMSSFTVKYKLPLANMKVTIPSAEDYHNEFSIESTMRSFTLRAKSSQEREEWVSVLNNTLDEYNIKLLSFSPKYDPTEMTGKKAPVWIQDGRVTMCQICANEFTVTFRRHHCRACGRVVCSKCSNNKAPLQYMNFQTDRVCDDCYDYLIKDFDEKADNIKEILKGKSELTDSEAASAYEHIKTKFKKQAPSNLKKTFKYVPPRLKEVSANDSGSQISGWLYFKKNKSWRHHWFVLKNQVLYLYRASEDVMALDSKPVLGYVVETFKEASTSYEDIDSKLVFQLSHAGQPPLVFYAETESSADRWIAAFREATTMIS